MKDIEGAILAEQQYLHNKTSEENRELSLYDYLLPYGYDNLSEFRKDKTIHLVKNLNLPVINITAEQVEKSGSTIFVNYLLAHQPCLLWNTHHSDMMYVPLSCTRNYTKFTVIKPGYDCESSKGNIMSFENDLDIVIILPSSLSTYFKYFVQMISNYLSTLTDKEITMDGNDILANGLKICGSASMEDGDYIAKLFHVSFANNSNLVMSTIPGATKKPGNINFTTSDNLLQHIITECLQ